MSQIKQVLNSDKQRYLMDLFLARKKYGKWSALVKKRIYTADEINEALLGFNYFKFVIKPVVNKLGLQYFIDLANKFNRDVVVMVKDYFGIKISKAYNYCDLLGFSLPINYKVDEADKHKSNYVKSKSNDDNDCSVRTFARFLDVSYDVAFEMLSKCCDNNPAEHGVDIDIIKNFCSKHALTFISAFELFNGKCLVNLSVFELYAMIPQLKDHVLAVGVYRHIFCVKYGVLLDSDDDYMHSGITFLVCKNGSKEKITSDLCRSLKTSPVICDIVYQRWVSFLSWDFISLDLRITCGAARSTLFAPEYISEIEKIMYLWRSKEEFVDWVQNYNGIVKKIARRMAIEPKQAENIILSVQKRHGIEKLEIPH